MAEPTKADAPAAEAAMAATESAQSAEAAPPAESSPAATESAAVSGATDKSATASADGPVWPTITADSPLARFIEKTVQLTKEAEYDEVYGLHLNGPSTFSRNLILQKFLRANQNDLDKASDQLLNTLKWRKTFQPLKTIDETFSSERFGGLGYITTLKNVPGSPNESDIICFNVYGAVKDNKLTFEDIDGFLRWRVGLMELSLAKLNLSSATKPIPDFGEGPDPYQCLQVHDYLSVSFLRQDPHTKKASSKAIEVFSQYYPETLSRKFFVNVPTIMGWMFSAAKLVLSAETVKKFSVLTYGKDLAGELGSSLPEAYGGTGPKLEDAQQLKLQA